MYRAEFQNLYGIERKRIAPTHENHLRLHRLERPEQWEAELLDAIWQSQKPINWYPDYSPFHEKLAAFVGVNTQEIVLGAGIEDFIRTLFWLCCGPGDRVAYTWPTCKMFDIYAEVFQARAQRIVFEPDAPHTVEDVTRNLHEATRLLILPNPGQPVETMFSLDEMRAIAEHCRKQNTLLAIDEAYYGFGSETCLPLIDLFENVLVLRTFSKAFGAAGIRVGYAVGRHAVTKPLEAIRMSGEIAGPSMTAASVLMDHWESHVIPGIRAVCEGRDWLREILNDAGFHTSGYFANHVLIDMGSAERAMSVQMALRVRGIHVRTNAPPVDKHLMVTCGSIPLMRRFYDAFQGAV